MAIETTGSTSNELDIESSGEYKVGRIRSDEECSSNISYGELGMFHALGCTILDAIRFMYERNNTIMGSFPIKMPKTKKQG
jgi:hypothetical protein